MRHNTRKGALLTGMEYVTVVVVLMCDNRG